jgi:hypothetical protein
MRIADSGTSALRHGALSGLESSDKSMVVALLNVRRGLGRRHVKIGWVDCRNPSVP